MRQWQGNVVIVLLAAILAALVIPAATSARSASATTSQAPIEKWEHFAAPTKSNLDTDLLRGVGDHGWELVAVSEKNDRGWYEMYFKRKVDPRRPPAHTEQPSQPGR